MPVVIMPAQTAQRLQHKVLQLSATAEVRMFFAKDMVQMLCFTAEEIEAFGGENGEPVVLAIPNLQDLESVIPRSEGGRLNYIPVRNQQVIAKLDPFIGD